MKVVSSLRPLCPACYVVRRGKKLYLRCTEQPRHKRRQGFATLNMTQTSGAFLAAADEQTSNVKSYDGFRLDSVAAPEENTAEATELNFVSGSSCSHCAKPLVFDMSARIKAKQDFIEMVEEAEEK